MRLIDADALKEDIRQSWCWETVDNITATTVLKQTLSDIDNAPTVEPTFGLFKDMLCSECKKEEGGRE